jgi:hypothetical protein
MANGRKETLIEIQHKSLDLFVKIPGVNLSGRQVINLMRAYRIGMKINGVAAAALREKHDLVEGMPMRRRQIRVLA